MRRERLSTWMLMVGMPFFILGGAGCLFVPDGKADTPSGIAAISAALGGLLIATLGLLVRDPRVFFRAWALRTMAITGISFGLAYWLVKAVPFLKPMESHAWALMIPISVILPSVCAWLGKRESPV